MGRRKKNAIVVSFTDGEASEHVTGSCTYIEANEFKIVIECGLSQSNSLKRDYLNNKQKFNCSVKDLDYIFVAHLHADHSLRVPLLYKRGCHAQIIMPKDSRRIWYDMAKDSAKIMQREAAQLSKQLGKEVEPLYDEHDVDEAYNYIIEYDFSKKIELNENISFKFENSGHIICGAQLELWLTSGTVTKKIIYTSDLGNTNIEKHYVEPLTRLDKCDLLIGETTYGDGSRPQATLSRRKKDIEKLKSVIDSVCVEKHHKVLIPVFALDRLPEILTELYILYKDDENFKIPVVIDTPLGLQHIKSYFNILKDEMLKLLSEAVNWNNVVQINSYQESKGWVTSPRPMIVLASSGMLTAGRSLMYAAQIIPNHEDHIIFCGYSTENSVGWKIKHPKEHKFVEIDGEKYRNLCQVTDLHSFSSHMQHDQLLDYYSSINCSQIALVHGQMDVKIKFAQELKEELEKKSKSTKVSVINKSVKITL